MGVYTLCDQCVFINQYNNLKKFFQIISNCQKNPVVVIFVWVTFNYKKAVRFKIILNQLNCNYWAFRLSDLWTIRPSDYWAFGLSGLQTIGQTLLSVCNLQTQWFLCYNFVVCCLHCCLSRHNGFYAITLLSVVFIVVSVLCRHNGFYAITLLYVVFIVVCLYNVDTMVSML